MKKRGEEMENSPEFMTFLEVWGRMQSQKESSGKHTFLCLIFMIFLKQMVSLFLSALCSWYLRLFGTASRGQ